ncbi:MAG: cyclic pyranopterin monophosphate synthase MoaC [Clostridiales bacterium]|nr:cyclic pyranopterin monophosphate synthase MoaC [Clostridiales bacterium]
MVDVGGKAPTHRRAVASGVITMSAEAFGKIKDGTAAKGDVLGVARIAGIMALKKTAEIIPLCHSLPIDRADIAFDLQGEQPAVANCVCQASPADTESENRGYACGGELRMPAPSRLRAVCTVESFGRTGVEIEALCGVNIALLTVYDMCKAIDKSMVITDVRLLEKSGGKSGGYVYEG